ncbi:acetylglutamate kinase [Acetoanaerobium pronyense]|uniref:Acetylglutamate kinase n=1 Tax=Acetoanaerobium pronyense TaxID=1482736 RepID=A0ABS4KHQ6_9FIRM|nr:acetylglutamate kinase [Acetoanaerobium pronyense]MBP2027327.1 acetylglutamate kinase [Acetoanaerobium pronyense]
MILSAKDKAHVLLESLSYIKKFHNQTVVIKYGGNAMINEELKNCVIRDISLLKYVGLNPVTVHGGGPEITKMMNHFGKKAQFVNGLRVTDEETMKMTELVLLGSIAPQIVSLFNMNDVKALGLSGKDGKIIEASQRDKNLGFVGKIEKINTDLITSVIEKGYVPIISPIGIGKNGESYNINSDEVAGAIATSLKAKKLILITDVEGVMEDYKNPSTLISHINKAEAQKYIQNGVITGGMIPKINCCTSAVAGGVERCHIIDGREYHSILLEIFTNDGIGTMITA